MKLVICPLKTFTTVSAGFISHLVIFPPAIVNRGCAVMNIQQTEKQFNKNVGDSPNKSEIKERCGQKLTSQTAQKIIISPASAWS